MVDDGVLERARRDFGMSIDDLWLRYFALGGMSTALEVEARLLKFAEDELHAKPGWLTHLRRITVDTEAGPVSYPAPGAVFTDETRGYGPVPALPSQGKP